MKNYMLNIELPILREVQMAEKVTGLTTHEECLCGEFGRWGKWRDLISFSEQFRTEFIKGHLQLINNYSICDTMPVSLEFLHKRIKPLVRYENFVIEFASVVDIGKEKGCNGVYKFGEVLYQVEVNIKYV